jgi:hypothetical protein
MDFVDHVVRIVEQVGFPITLVLMMLVLLPRYALRLLEMFRQIMEDFSDKLVSGIRQVVDRHETVVNRAEAITSRQEAVVSRLEAMAQCRPRGGDEVNGKH